LRRTKSYRSFPPCFIYSVFHDPFLGSSLLSFSFYYIVGETDHTLRNGSPRFFRNSFVRPCICPPSRSFFCLGPYCRRVLLFFCSLLAAGDQCVAIAATLIDIQLGYDALPHHINPHPCQGKRRAALFFFFALVPSQLGRFIGIHLRRLSFSGVGPWHCTFLVFPVLFDLTPLPLVPPAPFLVDFICA